MLWQGAKALLGLALGALSVVVFYPLVFWVVYDLIGIPDPDLVPGLSGQFKPPHKIAVGFVALLCYMPGIIMIFRRRLRLIGAFCLVVSVPAVALLASIFISLTYGNWLD